VIVITIALCKGRIFDETLPLLEAAGGDIFAKAVATNA
jgi:ATP phosphoribosyltransferase